MLAPSVLTLWPSKANAEVAKANRLPERKSQPELEPTFRSSRYVAAIAFREWKVMGARKSDGPC